MTVAKFSAVNGSRLAANLKHEGLRKEDRSLTGGSLSPSSSRGLLVCVSLHTHTHTHTRGAGRLYFKEEKKRQTGQKLNAKTVPTTKAALFQHNQSTAAGRPGHHTAPLLPVMLTMVAVAVNGKPRWDLRGKRKKAIIKDSGGWAYVVRRDVVWGVVRGNPALGPKQPVGIAVNDDLHVSLVNVY